MTETKSQRYVVSDLGFAYAVHDTRQPQSYAFPAGRDKPHPSHNALNTRRLGIFATRAQAQAFADQRNAEDAAAGGAGGGGPSTNGAG